MLHHIDAVLESLLRACSPDARVRFDAPGRDWSGETGPFVAAFPHRIEEDLGTRAAAWTDELDERGRVVARLLPARRYRVAYLLTAWAAGTEQEHRLLGEVLRGLARAPRQPGPADSPFEPDTPIMVDVAHPSLPSAPPELWTAFGIAPRAHLDVVLTATLAREVLAPLAAPPAEVSLGATAGGQAPQPAVAQPEPAKRRIRE